MAKQVEKVNPDLVGRDDQGKPYTVRYEAMNAMLLDEFLKEHRKVGQQEATITQLKAPDTKQEATIAQQQKEIKSLTTSLKAQASLIQNVSGQLEVIRPCIASSRQQSVTRRSLTSSRLSQSAATFHRVAACCFAF